jgi:O-antigen ligase/polysaccharide polymerase Wzy-like membrane protein
MRRREAPLELARRADWGAVWIWLLCFGLVVYLGLEGGGYDPLVYDKVGLLAWWALFAAVLVGAVPRRPPSPFAWLALGLLAAFVVWTGLSLTWTESIDRTAADLARVAGYLGVFGFAIFSRGARESQRAIGAVAAGIVLVALVGLLSRLHPAWFPAAAGLAAATDSERLSYPLNYWNGLAALIAIGLPLLLQLATCARSALVRALAAAALPAMVLTLFFTLSRGGIAAAILALVVFFALASDRLPKLLTLLIAAAGSAVLIVAADSRDALQQGLLNATARHEGSELLWIALAVCLLVGAIQAALSSQALGRRRLGWTRISHRGSVVATLGLLLTLAIAAVALGVPGRASNGWDEFKQGGGPGSGSGRLGSVAGQSRYQLWSAALRENGTKPLTGTGSGTFEFWWARDGTTPEAVRDTHSLYLQTLGELGIVGLILLMAFLLAVFVAGGRRLLTASARSRPRLAAAMAGVAAFCITAIFDWMWQIPVLAIAALLLGSVLVSDGLGGDGDEEPSSSLGLPARIAIAAIAVAAIVAIAIPLAATSLLRQSETDVREGKLNSALAVAKSAQNAQPAAAGPRLQEALVLEEEGKLGPAAAAAGVATEKESTNWRTWLVLSRIEAERGRASAAVRDYRMAKSLNPRSSLFHR